MGSGAQDKNPTGPNLSGHMGLFGQFSWFGSPRALDIHWFNPLSHEGPWDLKGPIFSGTSLTNYRTNFHDSKAIWIEALGPQPCIVLVINFTLKTLGGLKRVHGNPNRVQDICRRPMGPFSRYKSHSKATPDSKVHRTNMGPIWGRQDPGGPHVGRMNFAIWDWILNVCWLITSSWGIKRTGPRGPNLVRDISWRLLGRISRFESHMKALWS